MNAGWIVRGFVMALLGLVVTGQVVRAEVTLPPPFSNGMVLQRGATVLIYGKAAEGEKVTVEFRGQTVVVTTGTEGKWRVEIPPGAAGGPFVLNVKGQNTVSVKDVYVGDVWVCSGQSNMHIGRNCKPLKDAPEMVRYFTGLGSGPIPPAERGIWRTSGYFSNTGASVAEQLYQREKIPIGMVYAAVGGSELAAWLTRSMGALDEAIPADKTKRMMYPNALYMEHIKPLQPFRIKGVLWWQGETNCRSELFHHQYPLYFPALIRGWRADWAQGDFPFVFVQLQSLDRLSPGIELVRDGQRRALALPNTAMAVTFDLTNNDIIPCKKPGDVHPSCIEETRKPIVDRLVKALAAVAYGAKEEWSGPLLDKIVLKNDEAQIAFTHVGAGLVVKGKEGGKEGLYGFLVKENVAADAPVWDSKLWVTNDFKSVEARLTDDRQRVILNVKGLKRPLRVFYATGFTPRGSLYNSADLPAATFVSDPVR